MYQGKSLPRLMGLGLALTIGCGIGVGDCASALPVPKAGLLVPRARAAEVRARVLGMAANPTLTDPRGGIAPRADRAVERWPEVRAAVEPHVGQMFDVLFESNRATRGLVPAEAVEASKPLAEMLNQTALLGFMYYLTGEQRYADTAFEILDVAGRVPRWGWFNWDGANMPQIHYGQYVRNAAFAVDFAWDGWDAARRARAVEVLARRGVESYWRLVSLSPFMGLHHLRSKNQGNNAVGGALVAALAVGDSVPENASVWFPSLLQTYAWLVAHDIGWAGTNLESGLPGYWSVSMQNLYTAAACLHNATGIDLRVHPGFAEATWYPVMKEATVPPVAHGDFSKPYPKDAVGLSGIIEHKPIEMPGPYGGGAWWYDYAAQFPESPAAYFISKWFKGRVANAHQSGHSEIIQLLWVDGMAAPATVPSPGGLFKVTDREAMIRSGYGSPHTFLSFNGDMLISARNELLCATSGLAWHFPWHQYAVTESTLETEGEPFSPSMLITDSFDSALASMISAVSASSNVKYYARHGQTVAHQAYRERRRDILYVRSERRDAAYDYFVFVDRVAHDGEKWHAFNWHIWSQPGNEGSYEILGANTAIARRPNAAMLLATVSHEQMSYEQQGIPSQPKVAYVFDHNARLLRAIAGPSGTPAAAAPVALGVDLWDAGQVTEVDGTRARLFEDPKALTPTLATALALEPGARYRISVRTRKEDARMYENFAWVVSMRLLDAAGNVLLDASDAEGGYRDPHPLKLTAPASNQISYADWRETVTHVTAPPGVARIEARFLPADWGHGTALKPTSKIWLDDIVFTPLGVPERRASDMLVTVAMPLENDGPLPTIRSRQRRGRVEATITHPDGTRDELIVDRDGPLEVTRREAGAEHAFGWQAKRLALVQLESEAPVHAAFTRRGGVASGRLAVPAATALRLAGQGFSPPAGIYDYAAGQLTLDEKAASLTANSAESQRLLRAGLEPLAKRLLAERDHYTAQGWRNVALDAVAVTASATRDERFAPRNLIDNQTWELPIDGVVDYTLGSITTTQSFGYGKMEDMSYIENQSEWPLFFRPTYWLLPPRQLGEVTIKLKEPTRIRMVRLLNTSNAGLNDFAATRCRVTLLSADQKFPRWTTAVDMGVTRDRAFADAFALPEYFGQYGAAFDGILEPGVVVPFGTGWIDVPVDFAEPVGHVRINVQAFWAMGGGLNEVQIYAAE